MTKYQNEFKFGDEVWFFFYDLSSVPILATQYIFIKNGKVAGVCHEELDIYCDRTIYKAIEDDVFITKQNAISTLIKRLESLK